MPRQPLQQVPQEETSLYGEQFGTMEADYRVPLSLSFCPPAKWEARFFPRETETFHYVPNNSPLVLAPAPALLPAQDELIGLQRLKEVLRPERLGEIHDQDRDFLHSFWRLLKINRTDQQHVFALIEGIHHDAFVSVRRHKLVFNRPRPYQFDPALEPPFFRGHPSYPSGHATQAFAVALGLLAIIPSRAEELKQEVLKLATRIAFNREIAGLHFPTDTQAGAELANELHRLSRGNAKFLEHIDLAQEQWPA
jgi:hypothetical protein